MARLKKAPERRAGLNQRRKMVMKGYGGIASFAKHFGLKYDTVKSWEKKGQIPHHVASLVHRDYIKRGGVGFTAAFCRPDLKWQAYKLICSAHFGSVKRRTA